MTDLLKNAIKNNDRRRTLSAMLQMAANDHTPNEIMNAAGNLLIAVMAQMYQDRDAAVNSWAEIAGRIREGVEERYEPSTGKPKSKLTSAPNGFDHVLKRN